MLSHFMTEEELTLTVLESTDFRREFYHSGDTIWEAREVNGLFGIPDYVIAHCVATSDGFSPTKITAFEMKIRNWRRALTQAYRYLAFAHYSYVVMDAAFCDPAISNVELFFKSNIGLLSVDCKGRLVCHHTPSFQLPYSEQIYQSFCSNLNTNSFQSAFRQ